MLLIYFLHVHSRFIFPRFAGAHLQLLFMWAGGGKARHLGALSPAAPLGMLLIAIWIVSCVCNVLALEKTHTVHNNTT